MAKQHSPIQKRWLLLLLATLSVSTAIAFIIRAAFDSSCDRPFDVMTEKRFQQGPPPPPIGAAASSPLSFMKSKLVLLVSHELSLSGTGGPLLLMELAFLLRGVGAEVYWITNQKPLETDEVIYSLEHKMLDRGVQGNRNDNWRFWCKVFSAKGQEAIDTALRADLVVLNTAVAGKWLDAVLKENVPRVLPKVLWWIHEMRGHYFKMEYVKHLPLVAGAMIDSHVTAEYWKNRTQERLRSHEEASIEGMGRGECFGRITIEAMAFQLPVLGTAAGGTTEIVVNGSTGFLHLAGKEGVAPLAKNIVKLATHVERRLTMGKRGYEKVVLQDYPYASCLSFYNLIVSDNMDFIRDMFSIKSIIII
ncbi:hypothetical protein RJ639_041835 [Escallonia herrerae]|uniref:Glycosyl transferase family 1 domain-containing protein n=1 Tax=Escallonia herrerae TaxID=1293975 RepID=A0AA88WGA7_9ASTE|nr:hypothetical protein RJ639_041835 [Escallonia herrerae]